MEEDVKPGDMVMCGDNDEQVMHGPFEYIKSEDGRHFVDVDGEPMRWLYVKKVEPSGQRNVSRGHEHYFKSVEHLTEVDAYRVCLIFAVDDQSGAIHHAIKKLLLPGQRGGGKSRWKDIQEAVDTLNRRIEIAREDGEI